MDNFRYRHTNYFLERSVKDGRLLAIDAGWPCSMHEYAKAIKITGYEFRDIAWALVTHFHMDHAGLIGEFLARGIQCLVFDGQERMIEEMESHILKKENEYLPINTSKLIRIRPEESRPFFAKLGIPGEVIATPGHSSDSVTFINDREEAAIGDLSVPYQIVSTDKVSLQSWEAIRQKNVKTIFPSHANPFEI